MYREATRLSVIHVSRSSECRLDQEIWLGMSNFICYGRDWPDSLIYPFEQLEILLATRESTGCNWYVFTTERQPIQVALLEITLGDDESLVHFISFAFEEFLPFLFWISVCHSQQHLDLLYISKDSSAIARSFKVIARCSSTFKLYGKLLFHCLVLVGRRGWKQQSQNGDNSKMNEWARFCPRPKCCLNLCH